MNNSFRPFALGVTTLAVAVVLAAIPVAALQQSNAPQEQAPTGMTARGELLKVDATARTLRIKTAAAEMEFNYNDRTRITGAQRGEAGLATMAGSQVTVQYQKDGAENVATSIDVRAATPPQAQ